MQKRSGRIHRNQHVRSKQRPKQKEIPIIPRSRSLNGFKETLCSFGHMSVRSQSHDRFRKWNAGKKLPSKLRESEWNRDQPPSQMLGGDILQLGSDMQDLLHGGLLFCSFNGPQRRILGKQALTSGHRRHGSSIYSRGSCLGFPL